MKNLLLLILFFLLTSFNVGFCAINVTSSGVTTITSTQISTPIQVTIAGLTSLSLKVKAIDNYITNTTNSNYRIPVSQLYLNDGINEFQMQANTNVAVTNGISINVGGYTQSYTAIVKDIGVLPPGTYTARLLFDTSTVLVGSKIYTLSFTIPLSQSVSSTTNPVNITLTPDNVFDGNATIENTTTPQIVVKSNGKWKLILNTTGIGTLPGNLYFLITGVSPHVTSYITAQTQILPNQQYVLASGNATVTTPITGTTTTDYISIKYMLKNTSGTYIPEGSYNNFLNYTIQSED